AMPRKLPGCESLLSRTRLAPGRTHLALGSKNIRGCGRTPILGFGTSRRLCCFCWSCC
ncbi:unnamed protein product, partial [Effrenium voratum]